VSTVRVVTGANGLIGAALTRRLAARPGTLLALDPGAGPGAGDLPITPLDAAGPAAADLLGRHLAHADRAELYDAAGTVPALARIADTPASAFVTDLAHTATTYAILRTFALTTARATVPAAAVVLSSVGATRAHRYLPGYDAARAATESIVRAFTLEFPHLAARAIAVGPIAQSASTAADGDHLPALLGLVPRGHYTDLGDIAAAVEAFAHPCFDSAAGHTLTLDGGLSIQLRPATVERPPTPA
jgi:gluconate 5-dehydrogenase